MEFDKLNIQKCYFVPAEHFMGRKGIAEKAAFQRNALCWFDSLRLAQNVPTERTTSGKYSATHKMFLRNRINTLHTQQSIKYAFVPAEHFMGRKRIAEKAAFQRNALCWFNTLRLVQNVPTEQD